MFIKNKQLNFYKMKNFKLKKINVTAMQNINGGRKAESLMSADDWTTDACNSSSERCSSSNTHFTAIVSCCSACKPTNQKC
jgi:hypothetical protein